MLGLIQKFFDSNDREVAKLDKEVVGATNALEAEMEKVEDLAATYAALRERREAGETLEELMPEAFALTRESAKRYLGLRHYDVQLVGGAALHYGRIAEMKTGEGKTLVAPLALVLNALDGEGSHLVTTNDYLARTGAEWMGPVYRGLGLDVGVIEHGHDNATRREMYRKDVTYITNSELGFDYLRDNMAFRPDQLVLREHNPLHYAIIDEVDSILIDEARTPLIISGPAEVATDKYFVMADIARKLERGEPGEGENVPPTGDYTADGKTKDVHLTEQGIAKAEKLLKIDDIFSHENMELGHMVRQALRAKEHYHLDKQYVKDEGGGIVIVDEFTGRLMPGRRFGEGLHQAIEAKEGVKIERENQTLATVTYQNFFKLYDKIAGMTGTAKTDEKEFQEIYASDVLVIPTNDPVIRKDWRGHGVPDRGGQVHRGGGRDHRDPRQRAADPGRDGHDRRVRAALAHAQAQGRPARGAEREVPRPRGGHRGAGRSQRRRHDQHEHGGSRDGHRAGREPRGAGPAAAGARGVRALRQRHRAADQVGHAREDGRRARRSPRGWRACRRTCSASSSACATRRPPTIRR
ncbi:MAG: hypothetical protein U5J97_07180 [Trueperaceae bacterium]|nr:hypothetical protein [Trueperaceae bacterium]